MTDNKTNKSIIKPSKVAEARHRSMMEIFYNPGEISDAFFNHSVLCQTVLPYRDPGTADIWKQTQGNVSLAVQAMKSFNPSTKDYDFVGLPFGAKARLILSYINTEAVKTQSKIIDVESSMTAFIKSMGLDPNGRTIGEVKNQLRRLSTSIISLGYTEDGKNSIQINLGIVKGFEIWGDKDKRQRTLWNSTIELTDDYFNSLLMHAIPLDERALRALANNAMALDIYAWLAQRLHRIEQGKPQFVDWKSLWDQFGKGYQRIDKFKAVFRKTLQLVHQQYYRAQIEEIKNRGFTLSKSPSPIEPKLISISGAIASK